MFNMRISAGGFTLIIPVLNNKKHTIECIKSFLSRASSTIDVLIIDNGSDIPVEDWWDDEIDKDLFIPHDIEIIRNERNIGVYPTFQQGFENTDTQWMFFSHNDVRQFEVGWDIKLRHMLDEFHRYGQGGVVGLFGATQLGTTCIHDRPYNLMQLQRFNCFTTNRMVSAGANDLCGSTRRVLVLDGYGIIVNRAFINEIGGQFKYAEYPVHHMYDNDICLESHFAGFVNYVVDLDVKHLSGATSCGENWAEKMGTTDFAVHRAAHEVFYKKWKDRLPVAAGAPLWNVRLS